MSTESIQSAQPYARWQRRHTRWAYLSAGLVFLCVGLMGLALRGADTALFWVLIPPLTLALIVYASLTRPIRRRRKILNQPFPAAWTEVLQRDVSFYRSLSSAEQHRLRQDLQVFLGEKRITGIQIEIDERTRVLAGVSAVIPIFGFPDWEWTQINEVLIYPGRFDREFDFGDDQEQTILGMVGTGVMDRLMILSQPDLVHGFTNETDRRNVGVHEFAHIVDKSDGSIDGVPGVCISQEAVGPWLNLIRKKMGEVRVGKSDIDPYAGTSEVEFFAVASEYFFERPQRMQTEHPELYSALERVFSQSMSDRFRGMQKLTLGSPVRLGRNSPCPCGSGDKYKHCCNK